MDTNSKDKTKYYFNVNMFNDKNISAYSIGIYFKLLNWGPSFNKKDFCEKVGCTKYTLNKALKELASGGYFKEEKVKNEKGQFEYHYQLLNEENK